MLSIPLNHLELVNQNSNASFSFEQKSTGLFLNVKCSATYVNLYKLITDLSSELVTLK